MVLVEGGADNPVRLMPDGKLVRASDLASGRPIPAVKVSGPLRISDIPPGPLSQMKAGALDEAKKPNEPPRNKLPADAQRMRAWTLGQLGHIAAAVNPFELEELAGLRTERMKNDKLLGEMPLVVLTRGVPEKDGLDWEASAAEHRREHAELAAMSRKGKLVVANQSGHHVQLDEPELVIKSIREVLEAIRK